MQACEWWREREREPVYVEKEGKIRKNKRIEREGELRKKGALARCEIEERACMCMCVCEQIGEGETRQPASRRRARDRRLCTDRPCYDLVHPEKSSATNLHIGK